MARKLAAWKVAAAILSDSDQPMHYEQITKLVRDTQLTSLGDMGDTPHFTLHREMKQDHPDYFDIGNFSRGFFAASTKAKQSPEIQGIVERLRQQRVLPIVEQDIAGIIDEETYTEGERKSRYSNYHERNPQLRAQAIAIHGTACMIPGCGFNFCAVYGEHGKHFIEVHHREPVHTFSDRKVVNPRKEMAVVCSNCHRMIHRQRDKVLTLEEVGELIAKTRQKTVR
jgi:hypothetical protein